MIEDAGFGYSDGHCRQHWMDSKSRRLEDRLGNFIAGIFKAAALKRGQNDPNRSEAKSRPADSKD